MSIFGQSCRIRFFCSFSRRGPARSNRASPNWLTLPPTAPDCSVFCGGDRLTHPSRRRKLKCPSAQTRRRAFESQVCPSATLGNTCEEVLITACQMKLNWVSRALLMRRGFLAGACLSFALLARSHAQQIEIARETRVQPAANPVISAIEDEEEIAAERLPT